MFRDFLKRFGSANPTSSLAGGDPESTDSVSLPRPYNDEARDLLYNLLFCDHPELFRSKTQRSSVGDLLNDPAADASQVQAIADDAGEESRYRALAFRWLREHGTAIPSKLLLGVIVEVPQEGGLDTLAAFEDGRIRYINQSGRMASFETAPPDIETKARALIAAARAAVEQIGLWDKARLPPPSSGVRVTFVVSDGLCFGEGPWDAIANDSIGGPVLKCATELLVHITESAK
ncbi:MAG: hypothetical protein JO056_03440 [Alphaproteobacteria bacterium]|nr:hypothetical protein [Alphaproteobacteria bacterium]